MSLPYIIGTMPVTLNNSEPIRQWGHKKLGEAYQQSLQANGAIIKSMGKEKRRTRPKKGADRTREDLRHAPVRDHERNDVPHLNSIGYVQNPHSGEFRLRAPESLRFNACALPWLPKPMTATVCPIKGLPWISCSVMAFICTDPGQNM